MPKTEILIKLRDLHEELAAIHQNDRGRSIDEATIEALGQLITDAGAVFDQHRDHSKTDQSSQNSEELTPESLLTRVQILESKHPLVGQFLSQVTDVLSMMGI